MGFIFALRSVVTLPLRQQIHFVYTTVQTSHQQGHTTNEVPGDANLVKT